MQNIGGFYNNLAERGKMRIFPLSGVIMVPRA